MFRRTLMLQLFAEEAVGDFATPETAGNDVETGVATGEASEEIAPPEEQSFDELIGRGGKFHKEYSSKVQQAIDKRFKNQSDNQMVIDRMTPLLGMVAQRYGIAPGKDGAIDYDAIEKAINDDDSLFEKEAFDRGMSVADLKQMKQLEIQNERLRRENESYTRQQEADREWADIMRQGEELKATFPNFDINEEMQNPEFGRLLATFQNSGFKNPLATAYQSVHMDEILAGGMKYAMEKTAQNMTKAIASGSMRPKENGTSARASGNFGQTDPSKYTLKDFKEIMRRAERGERITLD